jgi:L-cysteine:1D-myo-inositol 2-amino-2-deoxy-alpha-D-glucopyranoside ligase
MRLFSTLTQRVEELRPYGPAATLYVCGITPYDTTHLGHAFVNVIYDTLRRYMEWRGQPVRYVQNVTDIDDDILRKAREVGSNWEELGKRETQRYVEDLTALNVYPPTEYLRASSEMTRMFAMIEELLRKGLAYEREGWVYYHVSADPGFGKLADAAGIKGYEAWLKTANGRGNFPNDPRKRDPLDFVMWQGRQVQGEPSWPSPWGQGRPGWHIECSALVTAHLGARIDVHGGRFDLVFPHHTCEIATSENANGESPFSQVWMHCAMVSLDGAKMSKSLGNLILAANLLKTYTPDAIRLLLLANHYRAPWEYFPAAVEAAAVRAAQYLAAAQAAHAAYSADEAAEAANDESDEVTSLAVADFMAAMDEDLDTPRALSVLDGLAAATLETPTAARGSALAELSAVLGLRLGDVIASAPAWVSPYGA